MAQDKVDDAPVVDDGEQQQIDGTGQVEKDVQVDDKGNVVEAQPAGDDGAEVEPPSEGLSEAERDIIRQHRKDNRKEDRQNAKERRRAAIHRKDRYISALETQLAELNQRVSHTERQVTGSQVAQLDAAIQNANAEVEIAAAAKAEAIKAGETSIFTEADEAHYNARRKLEELSFLKRSVADKGRQQPQGRQPITYPASTVELAKKWTAQHSWYNPDPNSADADSRIVRMLDAELVSEGWDHSTPEYWEELTDRARDRMPKRFANGGAARDERRGPTQITGGSRGDAGGDSPAGRTVTMTLSAERVKAAKEAGLWDDPKQRARLIKRYQEFDRQAATQQR